MKMIIYVGIAGALGALLRTGIGLLIGSEVGFPFATFIVNMIGTFLLCLLATGVLEELRMSQQVKTAITTGFLGSLTTFSALSMETILLVENDQLLLGALYVGLSMVCGLGAGVLGFSFGSRWSRDIA